MEEEKGKSQFVGPEIKGKTLGVIGLGSKVNGIPREDSFQITVASEEPS